MIDLSFIPPLIIGLAAGCYLGLTIGLHQVERVRKQMEEGQDDE